MPSYLNHMESIYVVLFILGRRLEHEKQRTLQVEQDL